MEKAPNITTEEQLLEIERTISELLQELEDELNNSGELLEMINKDIAGIEVLIAISAQNEQKVELESIRNSMLETKKKLEDGIASEREDLHRRKEYLMQMNRENKERRLLLLQSFDGIPQ
ncbi:MAG: hypothetical protein NTV02_02195 [Candidatus Zambryskibacteria bacterium]|nr:hypothetical protein [Candidatus Zambryskibacteria bacterium]